LTIQNLPLISRLFLEGLAVCIKGDVRLITNGEFGKDVEAVMAYFNILSRCLNGQLENRNIFEDGRLL
jgi:hypothetical protein